MITLEQAIEACRQLGGENATIVSTFLQQLSATPGTLVPPDELIDEWVVTHMRHGPFSKTSINNAAHQAAAWGYQQALSERQELAELLTELADEIMEESRSISDANDSETAVYVAKLDDLEACARTWAERLMGGNNNG
jgi:hypothetical protein